jgi:ankyrin repeat protein
MFLTLGCLFVAAVVLFVVVHRDRRPPIFHAVENGDTNAIAQYLRLGSNVNTPILSYRYGGKRDAPLLDIAVLNGQLETVEFLLKNGANPNQPDYSGKAPLEWVIGSRGNDETAEQQAKILKALIESGADPNRKDSDHYGYTPLINAASLGELEIVKILLAAGANINATNNEGMTALHFAENAEIAQFLIKAGADRNAHPGGETPAQTAVRLGNFSALTVLTNASVANP